jgi:hypothetical protein
MASTVTVVTAEAEPKRADVAVDRGERERRRG